MLTRKASALTSIILCTSVSSALAHANQTDFVDIKSHITNVSYDIKYATDENFVGEPIDGYKAAKCLVHRNVIDDLNKASNLLNQQGYRLKFFDCYRPEQAVAHFMRWAKDHTDIKTKIRYYPNLKKSTLVGTYIAEKSGHSKGYTIDLTLEHNINGQWLALDMGGIFDLFDERSNTLHTHISAVQKNNRALLVSTLEQHGFKNYAMEWWHFTYIKTPKHLRSQAYNFDVK